MIARTVAVGREIGCPGLLVHAETPQEIYLVLSKGSQDVGKDADQQRDHHDYRADQAQRLLRRQVDEEVRPCGGRRAPVRPRGRVVLVSGHYDASGVDLTRIVWSEALVTGSNCYGISGMETDFDDAIDLIASGRVEATKLVSHRLPFDDIAEAFRISADKTRGAIKVHVVQE